MTSASSASIVWQGTASVILPDCPRGKYDHVWTGERRVPACLALDSKGKDVALMLLPVRNLDAGTRWTTMRAEQDRTRDLGGGDCSCREWETETGDLIGDVDAAIADRIDAALARE